jgi:hypothetical protein
VAGSLTVVLAFSFMIRSGVLVAFPDRFTADIDGYRRLAETLRATGTYGWPSADPRGERVRPTMFRPPLYPLLLASVQRGKSPSRWELDCLHVLLGVVTAVSVWILARLWGLSAWAIPAAVLATCDPLLLYQSTLLMTETLATTLAAGGLVALTLFHRRPNALRAAIAGGALGLASLSRPTFLPWLVLCACIVLARPELRGRRAMNLGWMMLAALVMLAPWGLRNYAQFGRLKLTTTHGGYTFLLGNNPGFYDYLREFAWGRTWDATELDRAWQRRDEARDPQHPAWSGLRLGSHPGQPRAADSLESTEFEDDQFAYALAVRYIRESPGMFVYASLIRVGRLWGLIPHQTSPDETPKRRAARYAVGVWNVGIFALALVGVGALRMRVLRTPWLWGIALCFAFTVVHSLYWSNLRMRAPMVPVLVLLATAGIAWLAKKWRPGQLTTQRNHA